MSRSTIPGASSRSLRSPHETSCGSDRARSRGPIFLFVLGTAVGGVTGAVVGAVFSEQVATAISGMLGTVERRGGRRGEPRFDLLAQ